MAVAMHQSGTGLPAKSAELVERGDLDLLTLHVNELVAAGAWGQLSALREHCRLALQRGKQLWPVSAHIEYRLCLEAPGEWAIQALETATGRFNLGPLPEVVAHGHAWDDVAVYLHATPQAAMLAHERVLRGEDLSGEPTACSLPETFDLPLHLCDWEPSYALAEYEPAKVSSPQPALPAPEPVRQHTRGATSARPRPKAGADEVTLALEDLAVGWTTESNGRAEAVAVDGNVLDALSALGARAVEMTELTPQVALALMGWVGASGGAHGRRRGAAAGRFSAWAVLAGLAGLQDGWAANDRLLGAAAASARWYAWGSGEPVTGWSLHLAIECGLGPHEGRAFALAAIDAY